MTPDEEFYAVVLDRLVASEAVEKDKLWQGLVNFLCRHLGLGELDVVVDAEPADGKSCFRCFDKTWVIDEKFPDGPAWKHLAAKIQSRADTGGRGKTADGAGPASQGGGGAPVTRSGGKRKAREEGKEETVVDSDDDVEFEEEVEESEDEDEDEDEGEDEEEEEEGKGEPPLKRLRLDQIWPEDVPQTWTLAQCVKDTRKAPKAAWVQALFNIRALIKGEAALVPQGKAASADKSEPPPAPAAPAQASAAGGQALYQKAMEMLERQTNLERAANKEREVSREVSNKEMIVSFNSTLLRVSEMHHDNEKRLLNLGECTCNLLLCLGPSICSALCLCLVEHLCVIMHSFLLVSCTPPDPDFVALCSYERKEVATCLGGRPTVLECPDPIGLS